MRHRRLWPVIQWIERAGSGVWNDEEKGTGKSSSGGGDPDAPGIVPDHRCERGERKELSYAIVKPGDFPPEIDQILRRKKESAFQMAYESGDDLYILRGYGKQKSGGFSIQIEEVSKSENAVFVRTKLVGPAAKEEQKGAASCPYVVLKTKAAAGISVVFED